VVAVEMLGVLALVSEPGAVLHAARQQTAARAAASLRAVMGEFSCTRWV
jgi:hypothetical protein